MYPHVAHVFVDGGHLREVGKKHGVPTPNPLVVAMNIVSSHAVRGWASVLFGSTSCILGRVTYYDALPEPGITPAVDLAPYWRKIELLDDVHLGFGALRGLKKEPRQKGVDVLIAVDMLTGAFSSIFDVAVLITGDADFVPVVEEVKRYGVMVVVAADPTSRSEDLSRVADRRFDISPQVQNLLLPL